MTHDLLGDYTKAEFPLVVDMGEHKACLLAAVAGRVIGYSFYGETPEQGFSQVLDWDGQGIYSNGQFPQMNITPPPAKLMQHVAALVVEKGTAQDRLDAMPDAPAEWRDVDLRRIVEIDAELAKIGIAGGAA